MRKELQDGAPTHCTNNCLDFLAENFRDRVISRRSLRLWAAHSPDLSQLDYWLWGDLDEEVQNKEPDDLKRLKQVVNRAVPRMEELQSPKGCCNLHPQGSVMRSKQGWSL